MAVEHRVLITPELYPEGPDDGQLPRTFRLEIKTEGQRRDGRQKMWLNVRPTERVTVIPGLTRNQVADFITQAAGVLAYDGKD